MDIHSDIYGYRTAAAAAMQPRLTSRWADWAGNNNLLESAGFQADSHSGKFFGETYNVEKILRDILTTHPPGNKLAVF